DLDGPTATAVHVIDALARDEAPAATAEVAGPGAVGADITRGGRRTFVIASAARDGDPGNELVYDVPGDRAARHVVFDAPLGAAGRASVAAAAAGDHCRVAIAAASGDRAGFQGAPLVFDVSPAREGCRAVEDAAAAPGAVPPAAGTPVLKAPAPPGSQRLRDSPELKRARHIAGRLLHSRTGRKLLVAAGLFGLLIVALLVVAAAR